jgi:hypothetical protein
MLFLHHLLPLILFLYRTQGPSRAELQLFDLTALLERAHLLRATVGAEAEGSEGYYWQRAEVAAVEDRIAGLRNSSGEAGRGLQFGTDDYVAVSSRAKQYWVEGLHREIESVLQQYSAVSGSLARLQTWDGQSQPSAGNRRERSRAAGQRGVLAGKLRKLLDQLVEKYNGPGTCSFNYCVDVVHRDMSTWLLRGSVSTAPPLGWLPSVGALHVQPAGQRYLRCAEETAILRREVRDVVEYYDKQREALLARCAAAQEQMNSMAADFAQGGVQRINATAAAQRLLAGVALPGSQPPAVPQAAVRLARLLLAGTVSLLQRRLLWVELRADEGRAAQLAMHTRENLPMPASAAAAALRDLEGLEGDAEPALGDEYEPSVVDSEGQPVLSIGHASMGGSDGAEDSNAAALREQVRAERASITLLAQGACQLASVDDRLRWLHRDVGLPCALLAGAGR